MKAKMREELRAQLQDKRHDLKRETLKLQIELECIKNQNKKTTLIESDSSNSSPSPKAPKMKRIGGGYVPPRDST